MKSFTITDSMGKQWTVGKPTREALNHFETFVAQQAWGEISALRTVLPEAYVESKAEFVRLAGAKEYRAGGQAWYAAFNGPDGDSIFLLALLKEHHPEATLQDARNLFFERLDDVQAALAVMVPHFFEVAASLSDTPPMMRLRLRETAEKLKAEQDAKLAESQSLEKIQTLPETNWTPEKTSTSGG